MDLLEKVLLSLTCVRNRIVKVDVRAKREMEVLIDNHHALTSELFLLRIYIFSYSHSRGNGIYSILLILS